MFYALGNNLSERNMERIFSDYTKDEATIVYGGIIMREKATETKKTFTPEEEDRFYGIDRNGVPGNEFVFMDLRSIGVQYFTTEKRYVLRNIDDLKMKVSMMGLISSWHGTGKSEWEFMMAFLFMKPLREAWNEEKKEADITKLFEAEFTAWPTGYSDEKTITVNGNTYRVFDQEDVKKKVFPFFEILEETDDTIYLKVKVA